MVGVFKMKFLQVSDTHSKLEPLCTILKEKYPEHHVIHCGDIVDTGTVEEMQAARKALEPLKGRLSLTEGNHDCCENGPLTIPGITYNDRSARHFDELLAIPLVNHPFFYKEPDRTILDDGITLIGLNSCMQTNSPFDFACGEIGKNQLNDLDHFIKQERYTNPGVKIIVYLHHHPFLHTNIDPLFPFMHLLDAADFWRVVANRVHVIMFGHRNLNPGHWKGMWGIPHVLHSPATPGSEWMWEIEVLRERINVRQEFWSKYTWT